MAGGPYKGAGGNRYIIWSGKRFPKQIRESLKTKSAQVAKQRKSTIEQLERHGKHKPNKQKWYYNDAISPIVYSGNYDLEGSTNDSVILIELKSKYIAYKKRLKGKRGWGKHKREYTPYTLSRFVEMTGAGKNADDVDEFDVQDFLYQPSISSDHTRKSYLRDIKAMFNWGLKKGLTENKIDYQVDEPKNTIPVFLRRKEIIDICYWHLGYNYRNIKNNWTKENNTSNWMIYAWLLMASTGMRPAEMIDLRLSDVKEGYVHVNANQRGKTGSERTISYYRWAEQVLNVLRDPKVRERDRWMQNRDWLFGRHGRRTIQGLSEKFRQARRAVFPEKDVHLYNLRDSFAVWYFTNDTEITDNNDRRMYDLMRLLGHTKITMTQSYLKKVPIGLSLE